MTEEKKIHGLRIDKWLWAARLYKTRNLASEACKKNWVRINDLTAKASKEVKINDLVRLKIGPLEKTLRVTGIVQKRVSASLAKDLFTDLTPSTAYRKANESKILLSGRILGKKGLGRPTKKQRRDLDDFLYSTKEPEE